MIFYQIGARGAARGHETAQSQVAHKEKDPHFAFVTACFQPAVLTRQNLEDSGNTLDMRTLRRVLMGP